MHKKTSKLQFVMDGFKQSVHPQVWRMTYLFVLLLLGFASSFAMAQPPSSQTTLAETTVASKAVHQNNTVPFYPDFIRFFDERLQAEQVPGGVFAIVRGNQIEHIHSFGVRSLSSQQPITADTVFRVASVSKTFAAGLAAQLEAEQKFSWQDPLTYYLPQFSLADTEATQQIQVQHLLTHTVGIVPNAYDNLIEANFSSEQIIPYFKSLRPLCQPGTCYGYQNVLFNLITNVVEQTTGKSYQDLLTQNIFTPLQMRHASIGYDGYLASENRASPHVKGKNRWFEQQVTPHYYHFPAAAGVNASAKDLAQWLIAQFGYYEEVFPLQLLESIRQPKVRTARDLRRRDWRHLITNAHYGLGWRVYELEEDTLVYHGGWVKGFRASLAYSPAHEIGLVVLLNAESHVISQIATTFWADIFPRMQQELQVPYYYAHKKSAAEQSHHNASNSPQPLTKLSSLALLGLIH